MQLSSSGPRFSSAKPLDSVHINGGLHQLEQGLILASWKLVNLSRQEDFQIHSVLL